MANPRPRTRSRAQRLSRRHFRIVGVRLAGRRGYLRIAGDFDLSESPVTLRKELDRIFTELRSHLIDKSEQELELKILHTSVRPGRPHSIAYVARRLGISRHKVKKIRYNPPERLERPLKFYPALKPPDLILRQDVEAALQAYSEIKAKGKRDAARKGSARHRKQITPTRATPAALKHKQK